MLVAISTVAVILIGLGLAYRRRAEIHMPLMFAAFSVDIGLLLYIEWSRHAIEQLADASGTPGEHWFLIFHVSVSAIMLVLYLVQIASGLALIKGNTQRRSWHKAAGWAFVGFRLLNYVTSWMMN